MLKLGKGYKICEPERLKEELKDWGIYLAETRVE